VLAEKNIAYNYGLKIQSALFLLYVPLKIRSDICLSVFNSSSFSSFLWVCYVFFLLGCCLFLLRLNNPKFYNIIMI
jgi:hypothetical protein